MSGVFTVSLGHGNRAIHLRGRPKIIVVLLDTGLEASERRPIANSGRPIGRFSFGGPCPPAHAAVLQPLRLGDVGYDIQAIRTTLHASRGSDIVAERDGDSSENTKTVAVLKVDKGGGVKAASLEDLLAVGEADNLALLALGTFEMRVGEIEAGKIERRRNAQGYLVDRAGNACAEDRKVARIGKRWFGGY